MNEKKHECFVCGAEFATWDELMKHIQEEAKKEPMNTSLGYE